jgi:hypothetical protein
MKTYITRPDGKQELAADIIRRCRENNARYGSQIRRLARHQGLIAQKSRRDGKWYFADERSYLQSPEVGLDDEEALEWLLS